MITTRDHSNQNECILVLALAGFQPVPTVQMGLCRIAAAILRVLNLLADRKTIIMRAAGILLSLGYMTNRKLGGVLGDYTNVCQLAEIVDDGRDC